MSYESPFDLYFENVKYEIEKEMIKASQKVGIHVDKAELIKALRYDRGQYEKGYLDGMKSWGKYGKWIKENLTGYLTPGGNGIWHCSECGHQEGPYPSARLTKYCPNCGADMREDNERPDLQTIVKKTHV